MKIVSIFAENLYAFHYDGEADNEYDRLIEQWTDINYLKEFTKNNFDSIDTEKYINERIEDAEQIIDLIDEITEQHNINLESFFRPLSETGFIFKILPFHKGKTSHLRRRNDLRIYAIKIDKNCFVITGGAIKLSQTMQGNPETDKELKKLEQCRGYLNENGVFDIDSFYELINPNDE